jgi:hypothetical protein
MSLLVFLQIEIEIVLLQYRVAILFCFSEPVLSLCGYVVFSFALIPPGAVAASAADFELGAF